MNKYIFVMPLMAISLLASCGGSKLQIVEHFVTFESYGGGHFPTQRVKDGETATPPAEEPARGKDHFLGWFSDFDQPAYTFTEKVTDDITLYAGWKVAPDPETTCSFKFTGEHCSINGYKDESFEITLPKGTQTQFQINPDDGYLLPTNDNTHFNVIKGSIDEYDATKGLIKIGNMSGDIEIKAKSEPKSPEPVESYTITFDAGDGKFFNDEQTVSYIVKRETKLLPYIKQLLPPTSEGQTFVYYEYEEKDDAIDYDDVVTSDITLKANYLPATTTPTDDLTNFDWKTIKKIAVTGNPSRWFNIGATKKVTVNEKDHLVRIIDFNHDYSELPDQGEPDPNKVLGITFEFANVITKSNGDTVTTIWDGEYQKSGDNFDYRNSVLNTFLNDETDDSSVINMLPSSSDPNNPDLRDVIKRVDKKVGVNESETEGSQYYTATSFDGSDDYPYPYLFPLAHDEMIDNASWATEDEGSKYQYYKEHQDQADRIKRKAGIEGGDGEYYWLRSPYTYTAIVSWIVGINGTGSNYFVYGSAFGVAPAFCI